MTLIRTLHIVAAACLIAGCSPSEPAASSDQSSASAKAANSQSTPATPSYEIKENAVYIKLDTSMGAIVLELDPENAPISTDNFISYVDAGSYDGTIFHRVIDGFMIQGGGFNPDMSQRPTQDPIKNEWQNGLKNNKYTIAMARLGNRPDSATSQFFINVSENLFLDMPRDGAGYAVFGRVVDGFDVVDAIGKVETGNKAGHGDVPLTDVLINKAEVLHRGG